MALMPIVLSFVIAGALIGAGMHLVGPTTRRMRSETTRNLLDRASRSVIAWSVASGRLPTAAEFVTAAGVRDDPWRRALVYVYDGNLAASAGGGLCGRESTGIVADGAADTAFFIVSGGENVSVDTTPGVSGAYAGNAAISVLDLAEVVSLADLGNRAGCYDRTAGRLAMLNNELPGGCSGEPYRGDLFAEGGVPPYTWAATSLPAWMTLAPAGAACDLSGTPSPPGAYTLAATLTDSAGTVVAAALRYRCGRMRCRTLTGLQMGFQRRCRPDGRRRRGSQQWGPGRKHRLDHRHPGRQRGSPLL